MSDRIWADRLGEWIAWNHQEVEQSVRRVAPEVVHVRPSPSAPSVAFHAWHIGRWVDRNAAAISGWLDPTTPEMEVWLTRDLTKLWGLASVDLGDFGGTGAGLDDSASAALPLPDVDQVLDYVTGTFRSLDAVLARIDDDAILERTVVDLYGDEATIGEVILNHLSHADRHLGMIEALRGVLGERGTATV
jgi:hypothetical protein